MNKKIYFENLDALRSMAAILVLLSHILSVFLTTYFPGAIWLINPITQFFIVNGGFGVQIFFSLSGFLITYLLLSEIKETGKINLYNFYIRRILRIWPVYFTVIFFVFIVFDSIKKILNITSPLYESPWMSVLFLSNYDLIQILSNASMYANGMLSLTWSVSVEEQFYLVWPLLFIMVTLSRIKYAIIGVIFIGIIFNIYLQNDINIIYHHTISNFIFLGTGALVAYLQKFDHKNLTILSKISKKQWLLIILILLSLLIFTKKILITHKHGYLLYFLITCIFLFFFLLMLTYKVNRPFELSRIPLLVKMAPYTFGLYMYHRIAGMILETVMYKALKLDHSFTIDFLVMVMQFLLSFLLAYISYHYMEKRILKYKNKFSVFHK